MSKTKNFKIKSNKKLPESEVEIQAEVPFSALEEYKTKALKKIKEKTELPGFRKGNVPEKMLIEKLGEQTLLQEAAEEVINDIYPEIIESEKINPLGNPEVKISKLASGNPLEFSLKVAILPETKLPNYKKIAKEKIASKEKPEVPTEKEVEEVIRHIQKNYAHNELHKKNVPHDHTNPEIKEEDLPKITDEFVKTVGPYENVTEFKEQIKENLTKEKEFRAREKTRGDILEEIVKETKVEVPKVLIESELAKMLAQFKDEVMRAGMTFEDYLAKAKKTEEEVRNEWREGAVQKAKAQLVLNKISEEEKIIPDGETVRTETEKVMTLYQDADPLRARNYVAQMLSNEEVMRFLENGGEIIEAKPEKKQQ